MTLRIHQYFTGLSKALIQASSRSPNHFSSQASFVYRQGSINYTHPLAIFCRPRSFPASAPFLKRVIVRRHKSETSFLCFQRAET